MRAVLILIAFIFLAVGADAQTAPVSFDLSNYGVRIAPDKRVMIVLATIDAGRTENASGERIRAVNPKLSRAGTAFRERLDGELTVPDDLRQKIGLFLTQYKRRRPTLTDAEIVSPFVAMAYSLAPPPELSDPVITSDLPGDLLDVLDFAPLVREFYRRSGISAKLDTYTKEYQTQTDSKLQTSAREMVSELLDYLHTKPQTIYSERVTVKADKSKRTTIKNTAIRDHDRRFAIVPELLAPAGNVQFLNIRDDYFVIVPPDTDLSVSEARRAFIQYVVDAIVLTNANDVSQIIPGVKKLIDEQRKVNPNISPDSYLAVSRSLVAAIDAKENEFARVSAATAISRQRIDSISSDEQARITAAKSEEEKQKIARISTDEKKKVSADLEKFKQAQADETALRLSEDYEKGSVLSFYFAEQLKGMESAGFDIASSMRDILLSFDPAKETGRLAQFAEARKRADAARESRKNDPTTIETAIVENPVTTKLLEIQKIIESKNYSKASADLKALLQSNPQDARIHYNLGRVAMFEAAGLTDGDEQAKKMVEAKNAYAGVLRVAATDRALLSLTYVALARIYEIDDNKEYAVKLYDKAIEIGDVPGGAMKIAIEGKQKLIQNP
jgi:tetratricopeptide (TPR) repeat protein